jgi:hypothetical protein
MTAFASYAFPATGAPTSRTLPDRLADFINVKDYGAVGDGATDDTAALQAAFDASFGTSASPHGDTNKKLNKIVFVPGGKYLVNAPAALTVSGAANNGSGKFRLTVNSTTNYAVGHMVLVAGITGTGAITDANGWFGISAVPDSTHIDITAAYTSGTYSSGGTVTRNPLQLRSVRGFKIFGAGREASIIASNTTNGGVISTNGLDYGIIEGLGFATNGSGVAFDFNWDNTGPVALQATTFNSCNFGGTSNTAGIGCQIGAGGAQGSENIWLDCHFTSLGTGMYVANQNALQCGMFGGNFQSCNFGFNILGSFPVIANVGFQVGGTWDILIQGVGSFADGIAVIGCRSEQTSTTGGFIKNLLATSTFLQNCSSTASGAHDFCQFNGGATLIGTLKADFRNFLWLVWNYLNLPVPFPANTRSPSISSTARSASSSKPSEGSASRGSRPPSCAGSSSATPN